jgi:O-antigen/teichoic acid export membrane protein
VFPLDRALLGRLVSAGAPLATAAVLSLGFMHADKLLTTAIVGPEGTGQLTAGFLLVFGAVEVLGSTVLVALLPVMARAHDAADPSVLESVLARLVALDVLVGLPAAWFLSAFSHDLVNVIFGARFGGAGRVLLVLGWYALAAMVSGALAQALTVQHRQSRVLLSRTGALLLNLAVTIALLPRIGIVGAAIAMLLAEAVNVAGLTALLRPSRAWWARVGGRLLRLAPAVAGLWVPALLLPHAAFGVAALAGLSCYTALAALAGAVAREDRVLLAEALWRGPRAAWRRRWLGSES